MLYQCVSRDKYAQIKYEVLDWLMLLLHHMVNLFYIVWRLVFVSEMERVKVRGWSHCCPAELDLAEAL